MIATLPEIEYPSSDGLPMAESTEQFDWITFIKGNLEMLFRRDPMIFVAGDLFWYPVRGDNKTRTAPDTMVVFGRPKGPRPSYKQFEEEEVPPQVVFEVLSPSNRAREMIAKLDFYERFGVEEYYIYDFSDVTLQGWVRKDDELVKIPKIQNGWTSPRLNVTMRVREQLEMVGPNGKSFKDLYEIADDLDKLEGLQTDKQLLEIRLGQLEKLLREKGIEPGSI